MHDDWHPDRVVSAIGLAAQARDDTAVADALAAAIGRHQGRERLVARKHKQDKEEATGRQEEEPVVSGLQVALRTLRDTDPGMTRSTQWNTSPPTPAAGLLSMDVVLLRIGASTA
jgi:hypothetical protein